MTAPVAETRALLRLRTLREDGARRALAQCRVDEAAAHAVVEQRQRQIAALRQARVALLDWVSGAGAPDLPRLQGIAAARLAALDDELERAEVDLIDERQALLKAEQASAAALAAWQRAQARREAVGRLADDARRAQALQREQRAERELDGAPSLGVHR